MGVGGIPVAILPSCQDMKTIALQLHEHECSWVAKIRNTPEAVFRPSTPLGHYTDPGPMGAGQYNSLGEYCVPHTASEVFLIIIYPFVQGVD